MDAELDEELGYSKCDCRNKATDNSWNGRSSKSLRTSFGEVDVSIPRDWKGEFEPQLLKKNQTSIGQDIEEKILSMYAKGMTTGEIETHIRDMYCLEVSDTTVSRITDKILPLAKEWQLRQIWSEGTFAAQKRGHNLTRLFRRGLEAAENHCLLSAAAMNLTRLMKLLDEWKEKQPQDLAKAEKKAEQEK